MKFNLTRLVFNVQKIGCQNKNIKSSSLILFFTIIHRNAENRQCNQLPIKINFIFKIMYLRFIKIGNVKQDYILKKCYY